MKKEAANVGNKIKKQNAKLKNNAIFGKLIGNYTRLNKVDLIHCVKYRNFHTTKLGEITAFYPVIIVSTGKQYLKWSFRPAFKSEKKFVMEQKPSKKKNIEQILANQFILEQAY